MNADPANIIQQYISFEFFDSAGNVPTEFGTVLYFSNQEILGIIREGEKTSTVIDKTRGGKAAGSVVTQPRSYQFTITHKHDRRTWGKTRRLLEAIQANYRIKFKIYSGYLLWEEAFGTFNDYAPNVSTIFDWSVIDIGNDPNYRNIMRGYGLTISEFPVTVYEGDALPVPQTADVDNSGTSQSTRGNVGGVLLDFDVFFPNH